MDAADFAAKKTLRQPTTRAEFSLIRALISDKQRELWEVTKRVCFFGGCWGVAGVRLIASEKLMTVYLLQRIQEIFGKKINEHKITTKKKHTPPQDSVKVYERNLYSFSKSSQI